MRMRPDSLPTGPLRAQWLCLVAEFVLKQSNLRHFAALTTGYDSIVRHPKLAAAALALHNLRLLGVDVSARRGISRAVYDARGWEEDAKAKEGYSEPPYEISEHLPFGFRRRVGDSDPTLSGMLREISDVFPYDVSSTAWMDPEKPVRIDVGGSSSSEKIVVDLTSIADRIPPPPAHDFGRGPRGPIEVPLSELLGIADELDKIDAASAGRRPGNWRRRLVEPGTAETWKFDVAKPTDEAMEPQKVLRLDGLQHMIGLPGAGKTTLITLLLVWLSRKGYRVAVLLSSIETSLNLLADLRFYEADAGLLVGQAPSTRRRHADRLAERIASLDESRGLGKTVPGADLLGMSCVLDAYRADDDVDYPVFPHASPPCTSVRNRKINNEGKVTGDTAERLCSLASWCGRMKAPRELAEKSIWIGHILSTTPLIQPHFLSNRERIRYFEMIARTMDLVIVDEADGAQATLDTNGVQALDLTGSPESIEYMIQRDLFVPLSVGQNDMVGSNVQNYARRAERFGRFNHYLVSLLHSSFRQEYGSVLLNKYQGRFVTGNTVLAELFMPQDHFKMPTKQKEAEEVRLDRIREFWDSVVYAAMTVLAPEEREFGYDKDRLAKQIDKPVADIEEGASALAHNIRMWVDSDEVRIRARYETEARAILFKLIPPKKDLPDDAAEAHFSMLIGVTAVINQFNVLAAAQQAMVAEGVHASPVAFSSSAPEMLVRLMPEAIVGRFSGVRVAYEESEPNRKSLRLQYLSFKGTPRGLLYHWHELFRHEGDERGPNVLLASATSFLEESPSYHIPVGPDYVLQKRSDEDTGWRDSVWRLLPVPDPMGSGKPLRFSGVRLHERWPVLHHMIDYFYSGDAPRVQEMVQDFDPGRRVAFVVNSYEQVRVFKEHLRRHHPVMDARTIAVIDRLPHGSGGDWIVASQVESIGGRDDWDAVVFPMRAISRGVNIVYPEGPRRNDAVLGTVVFMTRPHPSSDSLQLVTGIVGKDSMDFDRQDLDPSASLAALNRFWGDARVDTLKMVHRLLRYPIIASQLGPLMTPFTADVMIEVLQTIGRAMRNGVKVRVLFADAAWAPRSFAANGEQDDRTLSMLVAMRDILRARINDPDPKDARVYEALYRPFLEPLENCDGLNAVD